MRMGKKKTRKRKKMNEYVINDLWVLFLYFFLHSANKWAGLFIFIFVVWWFI